MFGESVFAFIPDHEVRAAKLTNRWISGCWWRRDALSDEHLVGTKHGFHECRSVRRKPPGEQWNRRETVEARGTKWNFDVEMDSGVSGPPVTSRPHGGMPTATAPREIQTVPPPAPSPQEHVHEILGQGVHAELSGQKSAELLDALDAWDESCPTASAEEAKRGIVGDRDIRPFGPEFEFNRSHPEEVKNNLCDRQREFGEPNG